jgi:flagellar hook-associated protein FlgK
MIASLGNTTFASANTADSVAESVGTIFTSDGSALTGTGTVTQVFTSNGGTNGAGGDAEFTSAMNVHALSDLVTGDAGSDWIVADSTSNTSLTVGNSHALTHDGTNYLLNGQVLSTGIKLIPAGQRFEVVDNGSSAHGEGTKFSLNMNSSGVIVDESGVALGSSLSVIRSGVSKVFDVKVGTNDAKVTVTNDRGIYSFTSNDANLKFVAPEPGLPSSFKASDHGGATGFAGKTSGNNIFVTSAATAQGNLGLTIAGVVYEVPTASSSASTVSAQAAETAAALNNLSSFSAIYTATHDGSTGLISITQAASVAKSVSSLKVDSSLKDPIVSLISAQTNGSLSITASLNAASLGITVAGFDFEIGSNGFQAISSEGKPTEVAVGVSGLSGQRLSIEKLPPEDLIVVLDKEGSRRLGMQYENADNLNGDPPEENYQVRMTDSVTGKIELFDTKTGDSIATRFSNGVTDFELKKYRIQLSGFADQGDIFNISLNQSNPGDARNMDALIALSRKSESRDSFQDDFRAIALGVGSQLVSGRMIEQSATAMRDAAAIAEDELSGVNLDEEAGRLLEQQQAYKAAAEILQAAKSMFDALLNIM